MSQMYWEQIPTTKPVTKKISSRGGHNIRRFAIPMEIDIPGDVACIGVDPGNNFGFSIATRDCLLTYYGKIDTPEARKLAPGKYHDTVIRGILTQHLVRELLADSKIANYARHWFVFIEGPAHGKPYGQAQLEQIRFGFAMGLLNPYSFIMGLEYIPPSTARKLAFGKGTISGKDEWFLYNNNAADAMALAFASVEAYLE